MARPRTNPEKTQSAHERKASQRERQRAEGKRALELVLPAETIARLDAAAAAAGITRAELVARLAQNLPEVAP